MSAALFPPAVIVLVPFNHVVFGNIEELLYHPTLRSGFLIGGIALWMAVLVIVRRSCGRLPARLWLTLPWMVLVCDVAGAWLEGRSATLGIIRLADALVLFGLVGAAVRTPWHTIRAAAAAAGLALAVQGTVAHAAFVRDLQPQHIVGAGTVEERGAGAPDADAPGNVYHLLLDTYQSESFAHSTGARAPARYPGFTYYTRFNTNFPRTGSSEPSLIHGRLPEPGQSIEGWYERAVREGFWTDLVGAGAGLWIYPPGPSLCHERAARCVTSWDLERDSGSSVSRDTTIDLWALRLLPASLRASLAEKEDEADETGSGIGFSVSGALRSALARGDGVTGPVKSLPRQFFNLQQFEVLLADEPIRPARGQYIYYHGLIPHADFLLDERCAPVQEPRSGARDYWAFVECANVMIDRLVTTLRELNRLDDALIIVHADHGDPAFLLDPERLDVDEAFPLDALARRYQAPDRTYHGAVNFERLQSGNSSQWKSIAVEVLSSGLLLVKHPGMQAYREEPRPVQLFDIAPTVLRHFGLDASSYIGIPLSDAGTGNRDNVFFAHSRRVDGRLSKYRLTGAGWQFVNEIPMQP